MDIRPPEHGDFGPLAGLLERYLRETMRAGWTGSAARLEVAVREGDVRVLLAASGDGSPVGFIAWTDAYDLHHCVRGGTVEDMYVEPALRGRGVGIRLLAGAAGSILEASGAFLRGTAVGEPAVRKLYARAAVCRDTAECTLSGRAFRELAGLRGRTLRELATSLPDVRGNYEA